MVILTSHIVKIGLDEIKEIGHCDILSSVYELCELDLT